MVSSYKHFDSGVMYRLGRLLDSDVKIIIPDLQRDYCWGTTLSDKGISLAKQFANDLLMQYRDKSKDFSIGLLYGYEVPFGHLQLCDGQQRVTTLYLMLGLLNRKTRTLQDRLLSQREMDESQEPYLQYAIRETTLYFMNDLVSCFFCDDSVSSVADIGNQPWYFKEYDYDPSIKSMMQAMSDLEQIINSLEKDDPYRFAFFLCNEIKFIYYDMQSRSEGEKTFVIINTKGESLSPTENLKPLFLEKYHDEKDVSKIWEEWETFFWSHRNEDNGNDTADAGMREFFRWIMLIHYIDNKEEDCEAYEDLRKKGVFSFDTSIPYSDIQDYFRIIKTLFDTKTNGLYSQESELLSPKEYDSYGVPITNQNAWFRLLPVVYYMHKFPDATDRDIKRIYQFFMHVSNLQNVQKNIKTLLPDAIRSIKEMSSKDFLDISITNTTIFTDEEKYKINLIKKFTGNREDLEDELWAAENYGVWMSTIMPLIKWAECRNGTFALSEFKKYRLAIEELFKLDKDSELDPFRRLLCAQDPPDYPCHIETFEPKNLTYKSFGYNPNQWREIIEKNAEDVRLLLDSISVSPDILSGMQTLLKGISTNDPMVYEPELLKNCGKKLIQEGNEFNYKLVQQTRGKFAYRKSYMWFLFAKSNAGTLPNSWLLKDYWWSADGGCTFFEKMDSASSTLLEIDVQLFPDGVHVYLFSKDDSKTVALCGPHASKSGMKLEENKYYYRLNRNAKDYEILDFVKSLMF